MSVHVFSWVLRHSPVAVSSHRLVLLALADRANDDGTGAWPSVATLAREARVSERSVQYALRRLETGGHIAKTGIHETGTTIYRLLFKVEEGGRKICAPAQPGSPEPSLHKRFEETSNAGGRRTTHRSERNVSEGRAR
jgi:hypothetical protein